MLDVQQTIKNIGRNADKRTYYRRAIMHDALEMIDNLDARDVLELDNFDALETRLLNGADSTIKLFCGSLDGHRLEAWRVYSWGGCALVYNEDIARHYLTPSEFRKYEKRRDSSTAPGGVELLEVQARALLSACRLIKKSAVFC
ncbi:MAG: hypothetical protein J6S63_01305 [Atopobiaceae bacterium]|nr:hypothetical protein [Atopobiaceae bacterium]